MKSTMGTDENYGIRKARRISIRAFLPLIGLILIIVFGAIAVVFAPTLTNIISDSITIPPSLADNFDLVSGGVIFFALVLSATMLYTIAAPKPKRGVTERGLDRERKERIQAAKDAKKTKQRAQAKMSRDRKKEAQAESLKKR